MQEIIQFALDNLNYLTIMLFMAVESSFIPFPSEVVVPPAAWLACTDGSGMNVLLVILFATLGADIGALVNYFLARTLGRAVVYRFADSRFGRLCLLSSEKVAHSEEYFRRHGVPSTFFGRLVPAVRQLISIPAGLARMNLRKFLIYTTLGAGIWNSVLALIGYLIYVSFPQLRSTAEVADLAARYSHEIGYAIIGVVVLAGLFFLVKRIIRKRRAE